MKFIYLLFAVLIIFFTYTNSNKPIQSVSNNQSSVKSIGLISKIKGSISVNNKMVESENFSLYEKDIITTGNKSFVQILMKDDSIINIGSNSQIILTQYTIINNNERNILINLINGVIKTHFKNKNKNGFIKVDTRQASMGVRGTEFITSYINNTTEVFLIEGLVIATMNTSSENMTAGDILKVVDNTLIISKKKIQTLEKLKKIFNNDEENLIKNIQEIIEENEVIDNTDIKTTSIVSPIKTNSLLNVTNNSNNIPSKINSISENKDPIELPNNITQDKITQKSTEYNNAINLFKNKNKFNLLDSDQQSIIVSSIIENNEKNIKDIIKRDAINPLITPDNKVVFFENHPDLLSQLPKDQEGNVIGIKVDYNYIPIDVIDRQTAQIRSPASIYNDIDDTLDSSLKNVLANKIFDNSDKGLNLNQENTLPEIDDDDVIDSSTTIKVINSEGQVEEIPVLQPNDSVVIVPSSSPGLLNKVIKKLGL